MPAPRILFFGYSEVGHDCLSLLLERGDNVVALITHEDNPNEKIWFKTPALAARAKGIPVHTPEKVGTPEWRERIAAMRPDLILSVYYRNMIRTKVLGLAPLGAFNMHGSLLPRYRGRAPINWAVLNGEPRIGMTLHRMVKEPDAGNIVDQEGVDIGPRDTAEQAFRKVLPCARRVLARQIDALLSGTAVETPQDASQATYFGGRKPEDGRIDWTQILAADLQPGPRGHRSLSRRVHGCGRGAPHGLVGRVRFAGGARRERGPRRDTVGFPAGRGHRRRRARDHPPRMARIANARP